MVPQAVTVVQKQNTPCVESTEPVVLRIDKLRLLMTGQKKPVFVEREYLCTPQVIGKRKQ